MKFYPCPKSKLPEMFTPEIVKVFEYCWSMVGIKGEKIRAFISIHEDNFVSLKLYGAYTLQDTFQLIRFIKRSLGDLAKANFGPLYAQIEMASKHRIKFAKKLGFKMQVFNKEYGVFKWTQ